MFEIGWSELLVIAVVAILVVGPKDLPQLLRTVGRYVTSLRKMAGEFRGQFDQAMREADMADLQKTVSDIKKLNPMTAVEKSVSDTFSQLKDIPKAIDQAKPGAEARMPAGEPAAVKEPTMPAANDSGPDAPPAAAAAAASGVSSPTKRSVAERAADAWKKAVGDESGG